MAVKVKVKLTGSDAKKMVGKSIPDASGANYVSRNDLHVPPGASSGKSHSSSKVPYKPRPGIAGSSSASPVTVTPTGPSGFGPSYVGEGIDTVKPVDRDLNPVERARQKNNRTRDMRTNLGRGKVSIVETE